MTVTINPALDVSTSTERIVSNEKLRCGVTRLDPGGGGMNVARVITRLGGHAHAIYLAGGSTGITYEHLVAEELLDADRVTIEGMTRESFTVDETSTGGQYRFVLQGPMVTEAEWQKSLTVLEASIASGGYVVASGSLAPGVPDDFYARVARIVRDKGARCVIDASGVALAEALAEGVYMVKPSRHEMDELVGTAPGGRGNQIQAASELIERGSTELVALTLGDEGAILVSASGVKRLPVPQAPIISSVGAGDSFLGGFVLRLSQGCSQHASFCTAVAAGTATAMRPATLLCTKSDVERFEAELSRISH
ncbi:MAG: 1-phosphofructokinase family hexose kinase [Actinomycetales bacterium]|nr:1-phosphofructokinase family hexose kinase [Actinomycetales bacterium]